MHKRNTHAESNVGVQIEHATEIIDGLTQAYYMEIESVMNYSAASINLDGVRAKEIKEALGDDIEEEMRHARKLGKRIHILHGTVPGSKSLRFDQDTMQPRDDSADVLGIIRGVIDAEEAACEHYRKMIELCEGTDWATQELCIKLLGEEEEHLREFQGFLREYERIR